MASPVTCDLKGLTPEDFFRKWVRTDGSGNYALAVKNVTADGTWTAGIDCTKQGITWQDILALIAEQSSTGFVAKIVVET